MPLREYAERRLSFIFIIKGSRDGSAAARQSANGLRCQTRRRKAQTAQAPSAPPRACTGSAIARAARSRDLALHSVSAGRRERCGRRNVEELRQLLQRSHRIGVIDGVALGARVGKDLKIVAALKGLVAEEVDLVEIALGQVLEAKGLVPPLWEDVKEIWPPIEYVRFRSANSTFILATIVSRTLFARSNFSNSLRSSRLQLRPIGETLSIPWRNSTNVRVSQGCQALRSKPEPS